MTEIRKRGRPREIVDVPERSDGDLPTPEKIKEVIVEKEIIKEVIRTVPEKRLEGWELYKALKDKGYFQGGIGQIMNDVNSTESAYVPEVSEVYTSFVLDPDGWGDVRDALCREWIKMKDKYGLT